MELRRRSRSSSVKEAQEETDYSSDSSTSSDDLPPLPLLLQNKEPSYVSMKKRTKKSVKELLEESQSLVENIKDDNITQNNVEEKIKQLEIKTLQSVEDEQTEQTLPSEEKSEETEKEFQIFCVNDSLQFFNTREVTPSQCGYDNLKDLTLLEDELLGCIRVELEHVLSTFLLNCQSCCITDLKSFVTYILKNLVASDTAAVNSLYVTLLSILKEHPEAKNLQFTSAEIFMLLFNFGIDVDNCEFLMKYPRIKEQVKLIRLPINLHKTQNKIPDKWPFNLKVILQAIKALFCVCDINPKDVCEMLSFFIWMSLDFTVIQENLCPIIQECVYSCLNKLKKENWTIMITDAVNILVSFEFSSEKEKWKNICTMAEVVPDTCEVGIYLQKQISFQALKYMCLESTQTSKENSTNCEFSLSRLKLLLKKLKDLNSDILSVAVKFIDLCLNNLKPEERKDNELCAVLRQCESAICESDYTVKGHFVKIQSKLRITSGKDSVFKVSTMNENDVYDNIKMEVDSEIQQDSGTFDVDNVKVEEEVNNSGNTELYETENSTSFSVANSKILSSVKSDMETSNILELPVSNGISVESIFSVENTGIDSSVVCKEDPEESMPIIKHLSVVCKEDPEESMPIIKHVGSICVSSDSEVIENVSSSQTVINNDWTIPSNAATYNLLNSKEIVDPQVNLTFENCSLVDHASAAKSALAPIIVSAVSVATEENEYDELQCNLPTFVESCTTNKAPFQNTGFNTMTSESKMDSFLASDIIQLNNHMNVSETFPVDNCQNSVLEPNLEPASTSFMYPKSNIAVSSDNLYVTNRSHCTSANLENNIEENSNVNEDIVIIKEVPPQKKPRPSKTVPKKNEVVDKDPQIIFVKKVYSPSKPERRHSVGTCRDKLQCNNPVYYTDILNSQDVVILDDEDDDIEIVDEVQSSSKKINKSKSTGSSLSPNKGITLIQTAGSSPRIISPNKEDISDNSGGTVNVHFDMISKDDRLYLEKLASGAKNHQHKNSSGNSNENSKKPPIVIDLPLKTGFDINSLKDASVLSSITSRSKPECCTNEKEKEALTIEILEIGSDQVPNKQGDENAEDVLDKSNSVEDQLNENSELLAVIDELVEKVDQENSDVDAVIQELLEKVHCEYSNVSTVTEELSMNVNHENSEVSTVIENLLENVNHKVDTEESKQMNISLNSDVSTTENISNEIYKDVITNLKLINNKDEGEMQRSNKNKDKDVNELKSNVKTEDTVKIKPQLKKSDVVNQEIVSTLKTVVESVVNNFQPHLSCEAPKPPSKTPATPDSHFYDTADSSIISTVSSILDKVDKSLPSSFSSCLNVPGTSAKHFTTSEAFPTIQLDKEIEVRNPTVIHLNSSDTEKINKINSFLHLKNKSSPKPYAVMKALKNKTTACKENKHVVRKCRSPEELQVKKKLRLCNSLSNLSKDEGSSGSHTAVKGSKTNISAKVIDSKAQRVQKRKNTETSDHSPKYSKLVSDPKKCEAANAPFLKYLKSIKSSPPPKKYLGFCRKRMYSPKKSLTYSPKNFRCLTKRPITRIKSSKPASSNSEFCVSLSSDSDVEELYCDPKRYADLECMIIYESVEQIVLD